MSNNNIINKIYLNYLLKLVNRNYIIYVYKSFVCCRCNMVYIVEPVSKNTNEWM